MSLPLRINFDDKDYNYIILTKGITKETSIIQISLGGADFQLACNKKGEWEAVGATINDHTDLLKAIGRNIKLRYRL